MTTSPCPAPAGPTASRSPTALAAGMSLVAALFLAACGGGGDGGMSAPPPPPPPPPAPNELPLSAAASVASWVAYAVSLAPTETAEPLMLDLITSVPTSETDEPIAVP